jgi:subtilase family serine protease
LPQGNEPLQGVVGTPISLSPAMMNQLLGINQIFYDFNGTVEQADGQGQTIAIIDAYGSPTIINDVDTFDAHWGLSNADGEGNYFLTVQALGPTPNTISEPLADQESWSGETSLDVEWAHAIAPDAHIELIEAPSDSLLDLLDANVFGAALPGVSVVSNSWGGASSALDEPDRYDGFLTTPAGHQGETFFFSTGDNSTLEYPSASIEVVPVGGMTDNVDLSGNLITLGDWADSGGGEDDNYAPPYHIGLVSMDADPLTGVWVYDSTSNPDTGLGWGVVGGTSLACPMWAAYMSTIDQGLVLEGQPTLTTTQTVNDILIAGEGSPFYFDNLPVLPKLNAYPLWPTTGPIPDMALIPDDGNTGFGQPNTEMLTSLFVTGQSGFSFLEAQLAPNATGIAPTNGVTTLGTDLPRIRFVGNVSDVTAGQTISGIVFDVDTDTNALNTTFTGNVTISLVSGGTLSGTLTVAAVGGVATFSNVSIDKAGQNYVISATTTGVIPGESNPFNTNPTAASQMIVTAEPTSIWQYTTTTPVAVTLEDPFGNIAINDDSAVVLGVAAGPGTFSGSASSPVIDGVATFTGLGFVVPGAYQLTATDGSLPAVTTSAFEVVAIPVISRFLFNGIAISVPALIVQQQRNAPVLAAQGPPPGVALTFVIAGNQAAVTNNNSVSASPAVAASDNDSGGVSQFLNSSANLRSDDATAAILNGN